MSIPIPPAVLQAAVSGAVAVAQGVAAKCGAALVQSGKKSAALQPSITPQTPLPTQNNKSIPGYISLHLPTVAHNGPSANGSTLYHHHGKGNSVAAQITDGTVRLSGSGQKAAISGNVPIIDALRFVGSCFSWFTAPSGQKVLNQIKEERKEARSGNVRVQADGTLYQSSPEQEYALRQTIEQIQTLQNDPIVGGFAKEILRGYHTKEHYEALIQKNGVAKSRGAIKNAQSLAKSIEHNTALQREAKKPSQEQIAKQQHKDPHNGGGSGKEPNNNNKEPNKNAKDVFDAASGAKKSYDDINKRVDKATNNTPQNPNGIYNDAEYHHNQSTGRKSVAPIDGQDALNTSMQFKDTSSRRIGVSRGQIVILDETKPGEFHGHVRTWEDIVTASDRDSQKIRSFLQKEKWVNAKGEVIK